MAGVFGAEVDRALAVLAAGGTLEGEAPRWPRRDVH